MELWLFKYSRNGIITHMKQIHKIVEIQYTVSYPKWNEKETIPLKAITKEINKARSFKRASLLICYINCLSNVLMLTFSSTLLYNSAIGILSCCMVSRSRKVTHLSSKDWWSTVMHKGVPIAS